MRASISRTTTPGAKHLDSIARSLCRSTFPKKFAVELCAECNLACAMCHHPQMRRPKGVMPFELWRRCADQIAKLAPRTEVWFSFCGEPLLEPELLIEMLRYGKSIGLASLNVNTNGMLLHHDLATPLLDSGLDLIVFGGDGYSSDTYARVRIGGDRDTLYSNMENLIATRDRGGYDTEVQAQFIVMPENAHEEELFRSHWLSRGATVKVRNQLSWGGKFETTVAVPLEKRIACPWAVTMMHVFWDGRVPRCPGDTEGEEGVGNAWHEPLDVLWGQLGGYRDLHLQHRFGELPERCMTCKDWMTGAAARIRPKHGDAAGGDVA